MNRYIFIIGLLFFNSIKLTAQSANDNYILALSVDMYMNTSSRVYCDNFATVFKKILKVNAITNKDSIMRFSSFIEKAKFKKKGWDIDVRSKFVYVTGEKNEFVICSNGSDVLLNGRMIKKNKKFVDFLNSIINWIPW